MKCNAVLLVFARSCCELVGRNMRLAVLGADAAAGSAAYAAAGIIDNHDHAIELAVEIVVLVIAGAEDFTRIINAVKMHDIARADLETTAAADAGVAIDGGQVRRHPNGAVTGGECAHHPKFFIEASSLLATSNSA